MSSPAGGASGSDPRAVQPGGAKGETYRVSVASDEPLGDVQLTAALPVGLGTFDWLVPAVSLTVPGILIIGAVLLQTLGGVLWLPAVRRRLGAPRRRGSPRSGARGNSASPA